MVPVGVLYKLVRCPMAAFFIFSMSFIFTHILNVLRDAGSLFTAHVCLAANLKQLSTTSTLAAREQLRRGR